MTKTLINKKIGQLGRLVYGFSLDSNFLVLRNIGPGEIVVSKVTVIAEKAYGWADSESIPELIETNIFNKILILGISEEIQLKIIDSDYLIARKKLLTTGEFHSIDAIIYSQPFILTIEIQYSNEQNETKTESCEEKMRFINSNPIQLDLTE